MKKMFKEPQISVVLFDEISCAVISGTGGAESGTNLAQAESSFGGGNITKQDISLLNFK